jgi:hypothetical protein
MNRKTRQVPDLTRHRETPDLTSADLDQRFHQKLAKLAEVHTGLQILKSRLDQSKADLIVYFNQNTNLKTRKYAVGQKTIRYNDRKVNDGLSQKLILKGLKEYFLKVGLPPNEIDIQINDALKIILDQRQSKLVPTIEIVNTKSSTNIDGDEDSQEND